jgi:soluble lytic murein transglycosylase-like protein
MRRRRARFALDVKTLIVVMLAIIVVEALFFSAGWLIGAFAGTPTASLVGGTTPSIPSTRALDASAAHLSLASSVPSFSFSLNAATRNERPVHPNVESFTIEERPDLLPAAPVPPPTAAPPPPAPALAPFSIAGRDALTYESLIQAAAIKHGLSPMLIAAVTRVESDFDPRDLSNKGARGLMQVMPETGARFGITPDRLFDPAPNIAAGSAYLAWLLDRYRGDLDLALAGYNAGEGAVDQYGGIPPYRETRDYVKRVRAVLARMETKERGVGGGRKEVR